MMANVVSSIQYAADTALSSGKFRDVSDSAGAATICSESALVLDTGVCQRQSTEEHAVEC